MAVEITPLSEVVRQAKSIFYENFSEEAKTYVFAPGRVNLIGEHTDYNGGFVMPMALPLVTVVVGNKYPGDTAEIVTGSSDVEPPNKVSVNLKNIDKSGPKWTLYVKGVLANYIGKLNGFKATIMSTVPLGGGLSSSAAIEVSLYTFLDAINDDPSKNDVKITDKALACQKAENEYAGAPCGIMDQFISFMGKAGNALLIDCRRMTSTLIPLNDPKILVLITNSNVKHDLGGSEYPTRRKQCGVATDLLKMHSLRDATMNDIQKLRSLGAEEEIIKRANHVITEIQRTLEASKLLKKMDYTTFGKLMTESHISLRDDYNVSCPELDQLVYIALQVKGVLGSRMTGGGFGGCTVTLVYEDAVNNVIDNIKDKYDGTPTFYICKASEGASQYFCHCKESSE